MTSQTMSIEDAVEIFRHYETLIQSQVCEIVRSEANVINGTVVLTRIIDGEQITNDLYSKSSFIEWMARAEKLGDYPQAVLDTEPMKIEEAIKFYRDASHEFLRISGGYPPDIDELNGVVGISDSDEKGRISIQLYDKDTFIRWMLSAREGFESGVFEDRHDAIWRTHGDLFE